MMQEEVSKESFYSFYVSGGVIVKLNCLSCRHSYHRWYRLCVLIFQVVERKERRSFSNVVPVCLGLVGFPAGQISF